MSKYEILLVDDTPAIHAYVKTLLDKELGGIYNLDYVMSAEEMLIHLQTGNSPGLILLDINLPGLNGDEVVPDLVAKYPNVKIIIITAELNTNSLQNKLKAYRDDIIFISKPFSLSELLTNVKSALHYHLTSDDIDAIAAFHTAVKMKRFGANRHMIKFNIDEAFKSE